MESSLDTVTVTPISESSCSSSDFASSSSSGLRVIHPGDKIKIAIYDGDFQLMHPSLLGLVAMYAATMPNGGNKIFQYQLPGRDFLRGQTSIRKYIKAYLTDLGLSDLHEHEVEINGKLNVIDLPIKMFHGSNHRLDTAHSPRGYFNNVYAVECGYCIKIVLGGNYRKYCGGKIQWPVSPPQLNEFQKATQRLLGIFSNIEAFTSSLDKIKSFRSSKKRVHHREDTLLQTPNLAQHKLIANHDAVVRQVNSYREIMKGIPETPESRFQKEKIGLSL